MDDLEPGATVVTPSGQHGEVLGHLRTSSHGTLYYVQVAQLALMPVMHELHGSQLRRCSCTSPNPWRDCPEIAS